MQAQVLHAVRRSPALEELILDNVGLNTYAWVDFLGIWGVHSKWKGWDLWEIRGGGGGGQNGFGGIWGTISEVLKRFGGTILGGFGVCRGFGGILSF